MTLSVLTSSVVPDTIESPTSPTTFALNSGASAPNKTSYAWIAYEAAVGQTQDVTAASYNGVSMGSPILTQLGGSGEFSVRGELYALANPADGVNNLEVTHATDGYDIAVGLITLSDAQQTNLVGASEVVRYNAGSTAFSDELTTLNAGSIILQFGAWERVRTNPITPDANTTMAQNYKTLTGSTTSNNSGVSGFIGHRAAPTVGAYTLGGTLSQTTFRDGVLITMEVIEEIGALPTLVVNEPAKQVYYPYS